MSHWLPRTYLALVYLLLYVPIAVLVVFSFNDSRTGYEWGGLSLRWYEALFDNRAMVRAMWNSLWLALSAATVSTLIGALTALALHRYRFRGKQVLNGMLFVVMMSPEIVLAISLLALFLLAMQAANSTEPSDYVGKILDVANAPGEPINPGELGKALEILANGGEIDYQGATGVELIGPGESAGSYREIEVRDGKNETLRFR